MNETRWDSNGRRWRELAQRTANTMFAVSPAPAEAAEPGWRGRGGPPPPTSPTSKIRMNEGEVRFFLHPRRLHVN